MTKHVPTPVAAALGLVPTVLDSVRTIPGKIVQLPVLAVSGALNTLDATRRGYDDLAARGERLIARLSGTSFDELEDAVEDALKGTPLAQPYDAVEDALEDVVDAARTQGARALRAVRSTGATAGAAVQEGADAVAKATAKTAEKVGEVTEQATQTAAAGLTAVPEEAVRPARKASAKVATTAKAAETATAKAAKSTKGAVGDLVTDLAEAAATTSATTAENAAEQAKGAPTPKATQPDSTRIDTAAAPAAVAAAEEATAEHGGKALSHDELPLADYDHMTLGSLRGRLRSLSVEQLVQVRTYEKAHADRLPVVTMLDNRIAKLSSDADATPTGNTDATVGELRPSQIGAGGSKVNPAGANPR